jgi:hypothetical protein
MIVLTYYLSLTTLKKQSAKNNLVQPRYCFTSLILSLCDKVSIEIM